MDLSALRNSANSPLQSAPSFRAHTFQIWIAVEARILRPQAPKNINGDSEGVGGQATQLCYQVVPTFYICWHF